jgi:pyruvate dehydrogenase E2 component (dihydrolipoamide acetyltransferase)
VNFKFPDVGEGLSEGTLVKWLVKIGDTIKTDQPLAQVETDKAVVEIPAPTKGIISQLLIKEGAVVKVGEVFVVIDEDGKTPNQVAPEQMQTQSVPSTKHEQTPKVEVAQPQVTVQNVPAPQNQTQNKTLAQLMQESQNQPSHDEENFSQMIKQASQTVQFQPNIITIQPNTITTKVLATPKVRHYAKTHNIDLRIIKPSGKNGQIQISDVTNLNAPLTQNNLEQIVKTSNTDISNNNQQTTEKNKELNLPNLDSLKETQERLAKVGSDIKQKIENIAVNSAQLLKSALIDHQYTSPRTLASPSMRRLAREKGIDISKIVGSGENGKVTREDLDTPHYVNTNNMQNNTKDNNATGSIALTKPTIATDALNQNPQIPKPAPIPSEQTAKALTSNPNIAEKRIPMSQTRKVIAKRLVESLQHTASVTTCDEIDVTEIYAIYESEREKRKNEVRLSFLSFLAKITTLALKKYPVFNATLDEKTQEIIMHDNIHIGIAVATPKGLLVPVIKNTDQLKIPQIATQILDLATQARDSKLGPSQLQGSTFTITNIGSIGGQMFTPIINYPEVAILGVGKALDKPAVIGNKIEIRKLMWLSLSFDHRIVDGADAAFFLNEIKKLLENPDSLLLELQ